MIFQKHTYDFSETYLCFFRNIPMIFQKHTYVFSKTHLCFFGETGACFLRDSRAPHYALCIRQMRQLSLIPGSLSSPHEALGRVGKGPTPESVMRKC